MTTAQAFMQQHRLNDRDARVHQAAAADPGSVSPVSPEALTSIRLQGNAAYQSAQGSSQGLPNDLRTAMAKGTRPPLQQGQARTDGGTGQRPRAAQPDRTKGRDGNAL